MGATHRLGLLVEYVFNGIQDHRPDLVASGVAQRQHLGCPLMSSIGGFRTECVDQVNGGLVGVCPADHRDVSPRLEDREEVDDVRNGIMVAFPLPHCHILLSVLVSSDSYPVSFPEAKVVIGIPPEAWLHENTSAMALYPPWPAKLTHTALVELGPD